MEDEVKEYPSDDEGASKYADRHANRGSDAWFKLYEAFLAGSKFGSGRVKKCSCGPVKINFEKNLNS